MTEQEDRDRSEEADALLVIADALLVVAGSIDGLAREVHTISLAISGDDAEHSIAYELRNWAPDLIRAIRGNVSA